MRSDTHIERLGKLSLQRGPAVLRGPCPARERSGIERRGCVEFAKFEFSGLGSFRMLPPFQQTSPRHSRCPGNTCTARQAFEKELSTHHNTTDVREIIKHPPRRHHVRLFCWRSLNSSVNLRNSQTAPFRQPDIASAFQCLANAFTVSKPSTLAPRSPW